MQWKLGGVQKHRLQGGLDLVRHYSKVDFATIIWNSERIRDGMEFDPLDEIYCVFRASHHVGESKCACQLRFGLVSGEDVWDHAEANKKWKSKLLDFQQTNEHTELFGIDGETIEFEWNIFPGFTSLGILEKIRRDVGTQQVNPEHFGGRIIIMSMFSDIDWTNKGNSLNCISNSKEIRDYAKKYSEDVGLSSVLEKKISGMERTLRKWKENRTKMPIFWLDTL